MKAALEMFNNLSPKQKGAKAVLGESSPALRQPDARRSFEEGLLIAALEGSPEAVSDLTLEKLIPKEAASGNF